MHFIISTLPKGSPGNGLSDHLRRRRCCQDDGISHSSRSRRSVDEATRFPTRLLLQPRPALLARPRRTSATRFRPFLHRRLSPLGVVHDLGFHEPNCILEQYPFDAAYLIAKSAPFDRVFDQITCRVVSRGFTSLSAELQTALLEGMQTNLKILAAQIPGLTENDDLKSHRSAAKVYVFFVDWLWNRVEHQQNNTPSSSFTPRKKNTPSRMPSAPIAVIDPVPQVEAEPHRRQLSIGGR